MFLIEYIFSLKFLYGVVGAIVFVSVIDVLFRLISYTYKNLEKYFKR